MITIQEAIAQEISGAGERVKGLMVRMTTLFTKTARRRKA